jgi:GrpB-like predicted nucleotidyltransferase (UPF0157 family)
VLIGGRERVSIQIVDPDPAWPARFAEVRALLAQALVGEYVRIEHIGSTSVPGLAAKPVVDVLLTVPDPDAETDFAPQLEAVGLVLRVREPGHRMFRTADRDVHVHVYADDAPEADAYLVLRERLRASPEDRDLYAATKRRLAALPWDDMNDFADAKTDVITEILERGRSDCGSA